MKSLRVLPMFLIASLAGFVSVEATGSGNASGDALQLVADNAPDDAVGIAAVSSPATILAEFKERVDEEMRATVAEQFGIDIFDPEAYREVGLDLNAPAGLVILDTDPLTAVVTLGMQGSAEEARDAMYELLSGLEPPEGALVSSLVGDAPSIFVEDVVAVVFNETQVTFVFTDLPSDTEDKQGALSEIAVEFLEDTGEHFADANDISAATNFDGNPAITAIFNPELLAELFNGLNSIPESDDVTAIGLALDSSLQRFRMQARTVLSADSQHFTPYTNAPAFGDATDAVPGPVEFGFRVRFDPEATFALLKSELTELDAGYAAMLEGADEAAGIDIEEEVIGNLTGEIGLFLQTAPTPEAAASARAVAFFGVRNTEAAAATIAGLVEEAGTTPETREVGGSAMYVIPIAPTIAFAAHDGYIWIAADDAALQAIIEGESDGFSDDSEETAAAALFQNHDHFAAVVLSLSGQFGELLLSRLNDSGAPGTQDLLRSLKNFSVEIGRDNNVMITDASLYWDGDATAAALAEALPFRGPRNEPPANEVGNSANENPSRP